ncbi:hypothetical protein EDB80DRAFT_675543 [Ilyonectria destructans]|nr:hypothetical protein EDB80DRAFT_675543 [Ilyonectria destructans]
MTAFKHATIASTTSTTAKCPAQLQPIPGHRHLRLGEVEPSVLGGANSYFPRNRRLKRRLSTVASSTILAVWSLRQQTCMYVSKPTDATANATTLCEDWYTVTSEGETCEELLEKVNIPLWALLNWNPSVGSKCGKLMVDAAYCVRGSGWETVSYCATQSPTRTSSSTVTGTIIETASTAKILQPPRPDTQPRPHNKQHQRLPGALPAPRSLELRRTAKSGILPRRRIGARPLQTSSRSL